MERITNVCELYLSLISAVTDQMADAAAPYSGENMFEIEVRLLRHLAINPYISR